MAMTEKRITLSLTREDVRQLNALMKQLGENQTVVLRRAISAMYDVYFKNRVGSDNARS